MSEPSFVQVSNLVVRFPIRTREGRKFIRPVDQIDLQIGRQEVLAVVGESGSGKTTIGRALVRILEPADGTIIVGDKDVSHIKGGKLQEYRKTSQMIFQDPFGSLNPVKTVAAHLSFPVRKFKGAGGSQLIDNIDDLLERVGLTPVAEMREKFPHELSGGQRQRLAIARALAVEPKFLIADEPISMLDVSIRAGILQLLNALKEDFALSYLYITHDLASARYFGDRIMVLYGGKVMETATSHDLVADPQHPYTRLLLAATPGSGHVGALPETANQAPNLLEGRKGCPFTPRCPLATAICAEVDPPVKVSARDHQVACHHA